ncbi:MAG: MerR family transcriptional regulator [Anaerofustis stercorihominis]|nr:MerR family transcriptional regulator [Anaerofustis stercorihominis]
MKTVNEVSRLAGISVRTLHHYDAIGLLKPSVITQAGYRLYDDAAVERLQSILLFRELKFSLKEIKQILDSPGYDRDRALEQQIALLELQYERIGKLITFAREIKEGVITDMTFDAFDNTEMEKYKAEAKEKWGNTAAYSEYEQKTKEKNADYFNNAGEQLMNILSEIGQLRDKGADSEEVRNGVMKLQKHITDNFYTCTDEILYGLGQMYVMDERFKNNIDKAGGEGTAEFVKKAIEIYCGK